MTGVCLTFEHLLGLSLEDALALLRARGIFTPDVIWTAAPGAAREGAKPRVINVSGDGRTLTVSRFLTGDPREAPPGAQRKDEGNG